nr:BURP domain-containing protein 4-like isoform X39 [Lolium perenne]XP_051189490.1 BURP domain-containing protein 4-like isoform X40 [Lolium perenne]XP_051189491.1 BURP domain-containing protein 4-like isoform X41 [Lolium perenne]XP_051189492.1 BURP domain-containing protein 4-like isoform X42 [Lolium perenne]
MGTKVLTIAFVLLLLNFEKNAFTMAADPVTMNDRAELPASQKIGFDSSSYALHWGKNPNPSPSEENGFDASSYALHWGKNPNPSPSENGFDASSYALHWGKNPNPSPSEENGFDASSYSQHWFENPNRSPSEENGFDASSYALHWKNANPSPSEENGFDASSYALHWKNANPSLSEENGFDASSYALHWKSANPSSSASLVPEAQTRHWHIKVKTGMLFLKKILHVGTILPEGTMFARADMPKPDSSVSTPLEPKYFATIVSRFKIPYNSMKAKQVAETLHSCVNPIDREEPHVCTSSRKAMARFATTALGSNLTQAALTKIHGHESLTTRYVVAQIAQLSNHTVACHPMDFPYEVFYCHQPKEVQALRVQLNDMKNGMARVTATVMCHMNTSNWDKEYFELLGGERGEPVCHYMPQNYIMFY